MVNPELIYDMIENGVSTLELEELMNGLGIEPGETSIPDSFYEYELKIQKLVEGGFNEEQIRQLLGVN